MIESLALVSRFRYALDNHWGYIYGTAGVLWTQAKQNQKINYMVSNFGTSWKTNSEAQSNKYYQSAKNGGKWIGHYVADCSGLFAWAFKEMGGAIAHGSNSIYDRYCSAKGSMKNGKRTDGMPLKTGTAVFTNKNGDKTHIGLYVGNGKVIEAASTDKGVIESEVTNSKWLCWGELKDVKYSDEPQPEPQPEPEPEKGTAIVTGKNVALRQGPDTQCRVIVRIATGKTVKLKELPEGWSYVEYSGKTGFMMDEYIRKGE